MSRPKISKSDKQLEANTRIFIFRCTKNYLKYALQCGAVNTVKNGKSLLNEAIRADIINRLTQQST